MQCKRYEKISIKRKYQTKCKRITPYDVSRYTDRQHLSLLSGPGLPLVLTELDGVGVASIGGSSGLLASSVSRLAFPDAVLPGRDTGGLDGLLLIGLGLGVVELGLHGTGALVL